MSCRAERLRAGLTQAQVVEELRRHGSRVDVPLYSKVENEVVDLIAPERAVVAALLNTEPGALCAGARRKDRHKACCRLSARVPEGMEMLVESLEDKLHACGYLNTTAWVITCLKRLNYEYQQRKNKERKAADV